MEPRRKAELYIVEVCGAGGSATWMPEVSALLFRPPGPPEAHHHRCTGGGCHGLNPAASIPRCASGFFMNVSHTKPDRAFSAISIVMPVSIPTTSGSYQSVMG